MLDYLAGITLWKINTSLAFTWMAHFGLPLDTAQYTHAKWARAFLHTPTQSFEAQFSDHRHFPSPVKSCFCQSDICWIQFFLLQKHDVRAYSCRSFGLLWHDKSNEKYAHVESWAKNDDRLRSQIALWSFLRDNPVYLSADEIRDSDPLHHSSRFLPLRCLLGHYCLVFLLKWTLPSE